MDIITIIIDVMAGAIGGNATGAAAKQYSLGPAGNTIAGVIGGVIGGWIVAKLFGGAATPADTAAAAGFFRSSSSLSNNRPAGPDRAKSSYLGVRWAAAARAIMVPTQLSPMSACSARPASPERPADPAPRTPINPCLPARLVFILGRRSLGVCDIPAIAKRSFARPD